MEKYSNALGVKGEDTDPYSISSVIHSVLLSHKKTNSRTSPDLLRRVLPVLRDAAAAAHQHAAAGSVQHPESRGDGLHAQDGQPPLRQHHAGAQVDASAHAARLPQHQHGPKHQHHTGSAGGPLLCHGKEVSAASCHT